MTDIEQIKKTVNALLRKNFTIKIEDGTIVVFHFRMSHFHHLLGLHYLSDLPNISKPKYVDEPVKRLLSGDITLSDLQKSVSFGKIEKRMEYFPLLENMLVGNSCKIIIDFEPSLVPSTHIKSKYLLYKTDNHITYYLFGIALLDGQKYYPETFFVEPSKYYISGQKLLECSIEASEYLARKKSGVILPSH